MLSFLEPVEVADPPPFVEQYGGGPLNCGKGHAHLLRASGHESGGFVTITVERHAILRYTPCGAWIDTWGGERFVNLRASKQWASTTEDEAIDQLYHRKRKQVKILAGQLQHAEAVQAAMEKHMGKKAPPRRVYSSYDGYY